MALSAGTKLGPYEIVGAAGAGGMGEVYRARDTRLERTVAVKVLPPAFSGDPERLRRFEQEARAVATLNHPNILAIHDIGSQDGSPYLVSEFLEGETLRERLREGPLAARRASDYALQIAQGLAAAHEKGIVHRDLKPENIFITQEGRVKILDFGLAKLAEPGMAGEGVTAAGTLQTTPGVVLGTVGYMSPEQVRGQAADHRSDIFAFGAILYEMLAGERAFQRATSAETMTAILKEEPAELGESGRTVAPALERIVRRCLEKAPEQRFQSAKDLAFALEAVAAPASSSHTQPLVAPAARRRRWTAAALAVAVLAVAALAFLAGQRLTASHPPQYTQLTFDPGVTGPARFTHDGDAVVYSAAWNGGAMQLFWQRASSTQARPLNLDADVMGIADTGDMAVILKHHHQASWLASGTLARLPVEGGTPRPILDEVYWADITHDGKDFAVVRSSGGKERLEFPIGKTLYETQGWITDVRIAPDGKHIAFLDHPIVPDDIGFVGLVDLEGHYRRLTRQYASCHGLAWTPDGKEIWHTASVEGEESGLQAVDLSGKTRTVMRSPIEVQLQDIAASGEVLLESVRYNIEIGLKKNDDPTRTYDSGGRTDMAALSPDGQWLLLNHFQGSDYKIFLSQTNGAAPVQLGDGYGSGITADNRLVAAMQIAKPHKLILYPTGAGQAREIDLGSLHPAFSGNENGVTFSRDGRYAVFAAYDGAGEIRDYLLELGSGQLRPVTPVGSRTGKLSPDGSRVVTREISSGKSVLVEVAGGKTSPVPGVEGHEEVLGWTADGGSLLVWDRELPVHVYSLDVATGRRQLVQSVEPNGSVGAMYAQVVTSADGKVAAYRLRRGLCAVYVAKGLR